MLKLSDEDALNILYGKTSKIPDMNMLFAAITVAKNRLEDCQWYDYDKESFNNIYKISYGTRVILGIRFSDGSRGSVDGVVMFDTKDGYYLVISNEYKNYLTKNSVIEKWMKYPNYT